MKGIVFAGNRKIELRDFPDPTPGDEDVVIEIKASGMCGSDLHIYRSAEGGPGMAKSLGLGGEGAAVIGGHEPAGVVVARGKGVSDRTARIGARVMQHHYHGCGNCSHCADGWSQMCQAGGMTVYGVTGNGGHAKYMKCPAHTLITLPEGMGFEVGAAVACGTGTAYGALRRLDMNGGRTLAVFGQGPVGTSATMLAAAMGLEVIAIDMSEERLALARKCGATHTIIAGNTDPVARLKELTGGHGVHYALECSSAGTARQAAVRATRAWGKVCYVGEGGNVTLDVSPDLLRRQITLIGSWTFNKQVMAECGRFIAEHKVPIETLITHKFKLEEGEKAYELFDKQTMGKGMIVPG